jgi:hypothetical protein
MNIQIEHGQKILLLENFMRRMRERKQSGFVLDGVITQAERNALHTAVGALKDKFNRLKLLSKLEGGEEDDNMSASID